MENPNGRKTYLLPWKQGPSEGRNQTERMEQNEREREVNGMEGGEGGREEERERDRLCTASVSTTANKRRRDAGWPSLVIRR